MKRSRSESAIDEIQSAAKKKDPLGATEEERLQQIIDAYREKRDISFYLRPANGALTIKPDPSGSFWPPLHQASYAGDEAACRVLLQHIKLPMEREAAGGRKNISPLSYAIRMGHLSTAKLLVRSGCTPFLDPKILHRAIKSESSQMLAWLVTFNPPAQFFDHLIEKAVNAHSVDMLRLVIESRKLRQEQLDEGLYHAVARHSTRRVHHLMQAGADINAEQGRALTKAVQDGSTLLVNKLLAAGADPRAPQHILCKAMQTPEANPEVARLLLKSLSGSFEWDQSDFTQHPLWAICTHSADQVPRAEGHCETVYQMVLRFGVSPHICDAKGNRLVDCLKVGAWVDAQQQLRLIKFATQEVQDKLVALLASVTADWSPQTHARFDEAFKARAKAALLSFNSKTLGVKLPRDVALVITRWLAIADTIDATMDGIRRLCDQLPADILTTKLLDARRDVKGMAGAQPKLAQALASHYISQLKRGFYDLCIPAPVSSSSLPKVIGRLVGQERPLVADEMVKDPKHFEFDIPNPSVQPEVVIGRTVEGHKADVDLGQISAGEKVSRNHCAVRFNTRKRQWEIRVNGRNGMYDKYMRFFPPDDYWIPLRLLKYEFEVSWVDFTLIDYTKLTK